MKAHEWRITYRLGRSTGAMTVTAATASEAIAKVRGTSREMYISRLALRCECYTSCGAACQNTTANIDADDVVRCSSHERMMRRVLEAIS